MSSSPNEALQRLLNAANVACGELNRMRIAKAYRLENDVERPSVSVEIELQEAIKQAEPPSPLLSHECGPNMTCRICGSLPLSATPANARAVAELRNIANAERFNRERFRDDTEFADWVVSRCKHTLTDTLGAK